MEEALNFHDAILIGHFKCHPNTYGPMHNPCRELSEKLCTNSNFHFFFHYFAWHWTITALLHDVSILLDFKLFFFHNRV